MSDTDSGHDESLAGQRLRLSSLESVEDRIRGLREQESDLEVEHMAARAALKSAAARDRVEIDPALATRIGDSLENRRALEERLCGADEFHTTPGTGNRRQADRLGAGRVALQAWLDASRPRKPGPVIAAAKITLLIATIATVWAAIAIHPAFLLLLVVVVGPVSFAMGRGQDMEWHRVAARRRFAASGLADIPTWDDQGARARLAELQSMLENIPAERSDQERNVPNPEPVDVEILSQQIAEANRQIASDLAGVGLTIEDTKGDTGDWLRVLARAERARESLEGVKNEHQRWRAEATDLRDQLSRYLHARGVKPTDTGDTAAAIAEQLQRLSEPS
jgi:hypothetical protein